MNAQLAAGHQHPRARIMADVATVLNKPNGSTTSIEAAIAEANISPKEIAAEFGGNRELILAMVSDLSDAMSAPLAGGSKQAEVRQRLLEFGQRVTDIYANSHLRTLYRIAITESSRHTGLGRDFYEVGPGRLTQQLAHFLEAAQAEGVLGSAAPRLLASHLLSSLRTNLDVADTLSHGLGPSTLADRTYVRNVVDLFFHGINGGIGGGRQP